MKTSERSHWRDSGVFINFEQISPNNFGIVIISLNT